jgi:hypothetical protein
VTELAHSCKVCLLAMLDRPTTHRVGCVALARASHLNGCPPSVCCALTGLHVPHTLSILRVRPVTSAICRAADKLQAFEVLPACSDHAGCTAAAVTTAADSFACVCRPRCGYASITAVTSTTCREADRCKIEVMPVAKLKTMLVRQWVSSVHERRPSCRWQRQQACLPSCPRLPACICHKVCMIDNTLTTTVTSAECNTT